MPSSVEVVDPGEIRLDTASATNLMNRLTGRLHRYDEIAKIVKMQNEQLVRKIQELEQSQGESKSVKAKPVKKAKGKS